MKEIILAAPRGFCAGVDRAIDVVETALAAYGSPLYVKHEIVHNKYVVDGLREKGVIFTDDLNKVPEKQTIVFSAHGVSPQVVEEARKRQLNVIDATCPLVTKVHLEARRFAREGYRIILIGHRNHVEAIGTHGEAPEQIEIVENEDDITALNESPADKVAYLTQTTLSVNDTAGLIAALKKKFPNIEGPGKSDICYATTNRQEAVSVIAPEVDLLIVIGSKNSSNSNRLRELAESLGTRAYLIDNQGEINAEWLGSAQKVGVTSGASAPELLVQDVIKLLKEQHGFEQIREITVKQEDVSFKLPKNLQKVS